MLLADLVAAHAAVRATRSRKAKVAALADVVSRAGAEGDEVLSVVVHYLGGSLRQRRTGLGWRGLMALPEPAESPSLDAVEVDAAFELLGEVAGAGSKAVRELLVSYLAGSMAAARAAAAIVSATSPNLVLAVDTVYTPKGEIFDTALGAGIPFIRWFPAHKNNTLMLKRYTNANRDSDLNSLADLSWRLVKRRVPLAYRPANSSTPRYWSAVSRPPGILQRTMKMWNLPRPSPRRHAPRWSPWSASTRTPTAGRWSSPPRARPSRRVARRRSPSESRRTTARP